MAYLRIDRVVRLPSGERLAECSAVARDVFGVYRYASSAYPQTYLLPSGVNVRAHRKRVYRAAVQDSLGSLPPVLLSLTPVGNISL